ncbi:MAG: hypothetical protein AAGC47_07560 [Bacteroidota bacterium]
MITEIAALISALTALAAVIIGPLISAKLQRNDRHNELREKWIDELRDTISSIISHAESCAAITLQSRELNQELSDKYDFLVQCEGKAKMMLNPSDVNHENLYKTITCLVEIVRDEGVANTKKMFQVRDHCALLTSNAQEVFTAEKKKLK